MTSGVVVVNTVKDAEASEPETLEIWNQVAVGWFVYSGRAETA